MSDQILKKRTPNGGRPRELGQDYKDLQDLQDFKAVPASKSWRSCKSCLKKRVFLRLETAYIKGKKNMNIILKMSCS
ncbi:MAG: hypothetical protein JNK89_00030 [Saprospiraceae bacterium]|nr:hypothetical protein [Saprospiraceae bacterium]